MREAYGLASVLVMMVSLFHSCSCRVSLPFLLSQGGIKQAPCQDLEAVDQGACFIETALPHDMSRF